MNVLSVLLSFFPKAQNYDFEIKVHDSTQRTNSIICKKKI